MAFKKIDLNYLIGNDCFRICSPLTARDFVSFCRKRNISTSEWILEQLERKGIFYPLARISKPKMKIKIEYTPDRKGYRRLGELEKGEEWHGEVEEEYSGFSFEKEFALSWMEDGLLWDPSTKPYQSWESFRDENGDDKIVSYYSIFQVYALYNLTRFLEIGLDISWLLNDNKERLLNLISRQFDRAQESILKFKEQEVSGAETALICQIISNRYYPKTQSDRRSIHFYQSMDYSRDWNWETFARKWKPKQSLTEIGIDEKQLKEIHSDIALYAKDVDPLEYWYDLVSFISLDKKKYLKDKALLARELYSMECMIRLFYQDITGAKLLSPGEDHGFPKENRYGKGVPDDYLQYLEFLTTEYHINPRPRLILVVEGESEYTQIPRIAEERWGDSFSRLGIQIWPLKGIGNFEGKKKLDKYGALEKFIDYFHSKQTIVFVILDNEGRACAIRDQLIKRLSNINEKRTVTKAEYFQIWERNIEFDNFSCSEISTALTEISDKKQNFLPEEIEKCRGAFGRRKGNSLGELFKEKTGRGLSKSELLKALFEKIVYSAQGEYEEDGKSKRKVVELVHKIIVLASRNWQVVGKDRLNKLQESGYLGNVIEPISHH